MRNESKIKRLIIILLFAVFIFSYFKQSMIMDRIEENITTSQNQLEEVNDRNSKLQAELDKAGSDRYIEKQARERLGMVKDGEQVVNSQKEN